MRLKKEHLDDPSRNSASGPYFRRAGRAITVGISTLGAASPKALLDALFRSGVLCAIK